MATFSINIDAKVEIPYTPQALKINRTNCNPITETIPLGMVESTNTPGIEFLLKTYTGIGWKTIKISNIEYSNEDFYIEYSGSKLIPNGDPNVVLATIDVSTVNDNEAIPTLQLELDNITLTENEYLKFTLDIEDTSNNYAGKVDVYYYILVSECPPTKPLATITTLSSIENSCITSKTVIVNVPAEESRYVFADVPITYGSINGVYGNFTPETITGNKQYILQLDGANASPTTISTLILYVKQSISSTTILSSITITREHSGISC